jgi:hypothetical protein
MTRNVRPVTGRQGTGPPAGKTSADRQPCRQLGHAGAEARRVQGAGAA